MAPLRSVGNNRSAFDDFYARTGKDAVSPFTLPPISATGGTKSTSGDYTYHAFTSSGSLLSGSKLIFMPCFAVKASSLRAATKPPSDTSCKA